MKLKSHWSATPMQTMFSGLVTRERGSVRRKQTVPCMLVKSSLSRSLKIAGSAWPPNTALTVPAREQSTNNRNCAAATGLFILRDVAERATPCWKVVFASSTLAVSHQFAMQRLWSLKALIRVGRRIASPHSRQRRRKHRSPASAWLAPVRRTVYD